MRLVLLIQLTPRPSPDRSTIRPPRPQEPADEPPIEIPAEAEQIVPITPSTVAGPLVADTGGHTVSTAADSHHESPIEIVGPVGGGMVAGAVMSTLNRMRTPPPPD